MLGKIYVDQQIERDDSIFWLTARVCSFKVKRELNVMFLKFVFRFLRPGSNKYEKNNFLCEDKAETGVMCLKAKEHQTLMAVATR